jgi:hypothetical protein
MIESRRRPFRVLPLVIDPEQTTRSSLRGTITFEYAGTHITVSNDGKILVEPIHTGPAAD